MLELIASFLIKNVTTHSLVMATGYEGDGFLNEDTFPELYEDHFLVSESGVAVMQLTSDTTFIVHVSKANPTNRDAVIEHSNLNSDIVVSAFLDINDDEKLIFESDSRNDREVDIVPGQYEVIVAGKIADYEDVFPEFSDDISDRFKVDWTTMRDSEKPSVWNYIFIPIEECSEVLPEAQVHKPFTFWPTPAHLR